MFTQQEIDWLTQMLNATRVNPLAPDAVAFCQTAQSILAKMNELKENTEDGEQHERV